MAPLGKLSFKLHRKLADAYNGRVTWGYAQSTGISLSQDSEAAVSGSGEDWLENGTSRAQLANHNRPWEGEQRGPEWLRRVKDGTMEVISRDNTTAQIDPLRFCQWLLAKCQERGVQVRFPARATTVVKDTKGMLKAIRIFQNDAEIECMLFISPDHTLANSFSAMYSSGIRLWRLDSTHIQHTFPYLFFTDSHLSPSRTFNTHTQPTRQSRQGNLPCHLRD